MPVSARVNVEIVRGSSGTPPPAARARRGEASSAWMPGQVVRISHLPDAARSGIAVAGGGDVAAQLSRDLCEHAEAGHGESVAVCGSSSGP